MIRSLIFVVMTATCLGGCAYNGAMYAGLARPNPCWPRDYMNDQDPRCNPYMYQAGGPGSGR